MANDTPPSDGTTNEDPTGYVDQLFGAFTGGLENGIGGYLTALGDRKGSFGQTQSGTPTNPSVQYTRNPTTGQLINNKTGQPVGSGLGGLPMWAIVGGGLALAVVAFMALRR